MLRNCILSLSLLSLSAGAAEAPAHCQPTPERQRYCVKPSMLDTAVKQYDDAHWVSYARSAPARLLVFMPGTSGRPPGPPHFLEAAVSAGYRVISLAYNNEPSVAVYCPRQPDPACSGEFRHMRSFGTRALPDPAISNNAAESIRARLLALLRHLHSQFPQDGWQQFLDGDQPAWARMTLAGQSQGAGMAAYIAKQHLVERVIMFSSPWDFYRDAKGQRQLAPWLAEASVTPGVRLYGVYHARELAADQLGKAYTLLGVPAAQVFKLEGELPQAARAAGANPYHGQGVGNPANAPLWAQLLAADH